MSFPSSPSPVDRLALAVVTEPERALPAPAGAREDAMRHLLSTAAEAGVGLIATRPDGDGERLLGQAWPFPSPFQVTVRTVSALEGVDRVEARARRSLERLGLPRGDVLLVSNPCDLAGSEGRALWDRLKALKDRGLFRRIGLCAEIDDDPVALARRLSPDVVQLPCNLLDQRAARDGVIADLAEAGCAVHLSSVFAGGVLFADSEGLPPVLNGHAQALSRTRRRLAEARMDPMQAALAFTLGLPGVAAVVASVASAAELRAILAAAHAPAPDLDWAALGLEAPAAFAADARRRISTAA
ncbi:MAG TPA: aldo/keto reductase [Brevundimonas sp.]|uniref:aldo/keto reductase n=1 Tax=Brevundimonas sp. TaxID=1871086 RepID=UPI00262F0002|nr:aldo/keto reductase [Brevundimonas sp.]HRO33090.1 aldo/keto reductase [Brevundimonas sp.]